MNYLDKKISEQVLIISQDYRNFRGGIGAVIHCYKMHFKVFNHISTYPSAKVKFKPLIIPFYLSALVKLMYVLIFNRKIRIVHLHSAAHGSLLRNYGVFLISKYLFRKCIIFHSHGSEMEKFYNDSSNIIIFIFKHFMKNVDLVITLSSQWKTFFLSKFDIKSIGILENVVEKPSLIYNSFSSDREIYFLFLGLIGERKGVFDLLEVISKHSSVFRGKAKFFIGGNGEVDRLKDFIRNNKIEDLVVFLGWIQKERKIEVLNLCDVYILPSYNEGLPISILEAMSYGMPIISTNVGGIPDVLNNNINGKLIEPGDKLAIYNSLDYFIKRPSAIVDMGKRSNEIVEPYFVDNVLNKLSNIYSGFLNSIF